MARTCSSGAWLCWLEFQGVNLLRLTAAGHTHWRTGFTHSSTSSPSRLSLYSPFLRPHSPADVSDLYTQAHISSPCPHFSEARYPAGTHLL